MIVRGRTLALALSAVIGAGFFVPSTAGARILVDVNMTVIPGNPRIGDPVKIRVDAFRDVQQVTPKLPFTEKIRQTSDPAPFLAHASRAPDIYTLRGGKRLYIPLRRTGPRSYETATFSWPKEGSWWTTPRFFLDNKVWAFRERVYVRENGPLLTAPKVMRVHLVDEAAPGNPPSWARPTAYVIIIAVGLVALMLAMYVARLIRDAGSTIPAAGARTVSQGGSHGYS
ncbi:hypothetical protein NBH00_18310 [Paraconexibacter antarcticus]|uniref:Oxygen tolerance protein BatD n=1 Tax=Paraconexibacter antarcticus TaxID=2949664 RepID=A0ABY5DQV2_9ACTN|nr:hypothetical protein [Paraconexibacter antarcticus]UTI63301.1 hypothetical protein NBH00_18310 [Paraconexibacter antarcticus]